MVVEPESKQGHKGIGLMFIVLFSLPFLSYWYFFFFMKQFQKMRILFFDQLEDNNSINGINVTTIGMFFITQFQKMRIRTQGSKINVLHH